MLQWFADWTPAVHDADWQRRRTWPPGFRHAVDCSVMDPARHAEAKRLLAYAPHRERNHGIIYKLLCYRLIEGSRRVHRLTPRGRAALLHHGRPCPDSFRPSPRMGEVWESIDLSLKDDGPGAWRAELVEYRDDDYQGRHTLTTARASITRPHSNGTFLNGSIRQHRTWVEINVLSASRQIVCEVAFSLEGFADLLTAQSEVPATILSYVGHDGMMRSEPAAPAVSPQRRMRERLSAAEDTQAARLREIATKVEAANIGKRLKEELLSDLGHDANLGDDNRAWVVTQAAEEVSSVVESMVTIAAERQQLFASGYTLTEGARLALGDGEEPAD